MDTAGKAVLFSGLTVLVSLSAVMLVPSPAFRSTSLGIMVAVLFVLAATLTLLPAVLAKLGPRVDRLSLPWVHSGEHRSPRFARWGELLWRRPYLFGGLGAGGAGGAGASGALAAHRDALDQGRAARRSLPAGLRADPGGLRPGRAGRPPDRRPGSARRRGDARCRPTPASRRSLPPRPGGGGLALVEAIPTSDPSSPELGATIDRLRARASRRRARRRRRRPRTTTSRPRWRRRRRW